MLLQAPPAIPVTKGLLGPWSQGWLKLLSLAGGSGVFQALGPLEPQGPVLGEQDYFVRTLALIPPFFSHPRACLCHSVKEQNTPGLVENAAPRKEEAGAGVPARPLISVGPCPASDQVGS